MTRRALIWRVVKRVGLGLLVLVALPLILLVVVLLAIPVRYKVDAVTGVGGDGQHKAVVGVSYLFGLVRLAYNYLDGEGKVTPRLFGIPLKSRTAHSTHDIKKAPKKDKPPKAASKEKKPSKKKPKPSLKQKYVKLKSNTNMVLTYPNRKAIIGHFLSMLKKQWKILKPKRINISGIVGFTDPSHTGFFFAAYGVVAEFLDIRRYIQLSGNFDTPHTVVQLQIHAKGSIRLGRMIIPIIGLLLKKEIRKLIKDIINLGEEDSNE